MRLIAAFFSCLTFISPSFAQSPTTSSAVTAPVLPDQPLTIPVPAKGRVRLDLDTRGDDVLGIVKSFLQGFNGTTAAAFQPVHSSGTMPNWALALNNANLADVLKDVNHLHVVVLELPAAGAPVKPALVGPSASPALPATAPDTPLKLTAFYEDAFRAEGGHRILWLDADDTRALIIGFSQPHGFALVLQSPGMLAIARADGYPNAQSLAPLLASFAISSGTTH